MKKFELAFKNEKEKFYRTITWIIIACNIVSLVLLSASTNFTKWSPLFFALLTVLSLWLSRYFKNLSETPSFYAPFLILLIAWLSTPYWWVVIINIFFEMMDIIARRKLLVRIFPDKIIYPSWPIRKIKWEDLNNLVLKDGMLTIDFKNNRLFQQQILNSEEDVNEEEFNAFCRQQLNK